MDYTALSGRYDNIMLGSGYYDYDAVARHLAADPARRVLELGCGTGLVIERLLKTRDGYEKVTGVDVTQAMLDQAAGRLWHWPQVFLHHADVTTMRLPGRPYGMAWSQGGPWYAVPGRAGESWGLISHITGHAGVRASLERVAAHLEPGGRLLLGIQDRHRSYATPRPLPGGVSYTQTVTPDGDGFVKEYFVLSAAGQVLDHQVTRYLEVPGSQAEAMLAAAGFRPATRGPGFLGFAKEAA